VKQKRTDDGSQKASFSPVLGIAALPDTHVSRSNYCPVYDKPIIYYPLSTTDDGRIRDVLLTDAAGCATFRSDARRRQSVGK